MLATSGLNDWHNLAQRLKSHEASNEHIFGMSKWIESEIRLRLNETIDKSVEDQIKKEKVHWKGLEDVLKHEGTSDIDGKDLFSELQVLKDCLPRETTKPVEVLNFLKQMEGCIPNAWIAYRILLTIPVTVASGERSFSRLKLIKSYLRSTMSQERLNGLAILSIESEMAEEIDCEGIISTFAAKTARRVMFK
ncbi:uncharacterized protein LOC131298538 [Rhododendron vialii]|uniref:uncharacterized protein LOC131298538 n=1 Tax=Rhododendron vialii TaxID=182163 RepID=UPI00265F287B|nr:uncharacterized protein LOC131298538 [Rhododendron vialii]